MTQPRPLQPTASYPSEPAGDFIAPDRHAGVYCFEAVVPVGVGQLGLVPTSMPPRRVHVEEVVAGSWADKAGVSAGDELVALGDTAMGELFEAEFVNLLQNVRPLRVTMSRPWNADEYFGSLLRVYDFDAAADSRHDTVVASAEDLMTEGRRESLSDAESEGDHYTDALARKDGTTDFQVEQEDIRKVAQQVRQQLGNFKVGVGKKAEHSGEDGGAITSPGAAGRLVPHEPAHGADSRGNSPLFMAMQPTGQVRLDSETFAAASPSQVPAVVSHERASHVQAPGDEIPAASVAASHLASEPLEARASQRYRRSPTTSDERLQPRGNQVSVAPAAPKSREPVDAISELSLEGGLYMKRVVPHKWAASCGVQEGDCLVAVNGRRLADVGDEDLRRLLSEIRPLKLDFLRRSSAQKEGSKQRHPSHFQLTASAQVRHLGFATSPDHPEKLVGQEQQHEECQGQWDNVFDVHKSGMKEQEHAEPSPRQLKNAKMRPTKLVSFTAIANEGEDKLGIVLIAANRSAGLVVEHVDQEGWAAKAGIRVDDRIVAVDRRKVIGMTDADLAAFITHSRPLEVDVVGERDNWPARAQEDDDEGRPEFVLKPGALFHYTVEATRQDLHLGFVCADAAHGMLIERVAKGRWAARVGVSVGDRLVEANGQPIYVMEDERLREIIGNTRPLRLEFVRGYVDCVVHATQDDKDLGVVLSALPPDPAVVEEVLPGGLAEQAGVAAGDLLVSLGSCWVGGMDANDVSGCLRCTRPLTLGFAFGKDTLPSATEKTITKFRSTAHEPLGAREKHILDHLHGERGRAEASPRSRAKTEAASPAPETRHEAHGFNARAAQAAADGLGDSARLAITSVHDVTGDPACAPTAADKLISGAGGCQPHVAEAAAAAPRSPNEAARSASKVAQPAHAAPSAAATTILDSSGDAAFLSPAAANIVTGVRAFQKDAPSVGNAATQDATDAPGAAGGTVADAIGAASEAEVEATVGKGASTAECGRRAWEAEHEAEDLSATARLAAAATAGRGSSGHVSGAPLEGANLATATPPSAGEANVGGRAGDDARDAPEERQRYKAEETKSAGMTRAAEEVGDDGSHAPDEAAKDTETFETVGCSDSGFAKAIGNAVTDIADAAAHGKSEVPAVKPRVATKPARRSDAGGTALPAPWEPGLASAGAGDVAKFAEGSDAEAARPLGEAVAEAAAPAHQEPGTVEAANVDEGADAEAICAANDRTAEDATAARYGPEEVGVEAPTFQLATGDSDAQAAVATGDELADAAGFEDKEPQEIAAEALAYVNVLCSSDAEAAHVDHNQLAENSTTAHQGPVDHSVETPNLEQAAGVSDGKAETAAGAIHLDSDAKLAETTSVLNAAGRCVADAAKPNAVSSAESPMAAQAESLQPDVEAAVSNEVAAGVETSISEHAAEDSDAEPATAPGSAVTEGVEPMHQDSVEEVAEAIVVDNAAEGADVDAAESAGGVVAEAAMAEQTGLPQPGVEAAVSDDVAGESAAAAVCNASTEAPPTDAMLCRMSCSAIGTETTAAAEVPYAEAEHLPRLFLPERRLPPAALALQKKHQQEHEPRAATRRVESADAVQEKERKSGSKAEYLGEQPAEFSLWSSLLLSISGPATDEAAEDTRISRRRKAAARLFSILDVNKTNTVERWEVLALYDARRRQSRSSVEGDDNIQIKKAFDEAGIQRISRHDFMEYIVGKFPDDEDAFHDAVSELTAIAEKLHADRGACSCGATVDKDDVFCGSCGNSIAWLSQDCRPLEGHAVFF